MRNQPNQRKTDSIQEILPGFAENLNSLVTIKLASEWATGHLGRLVSPSNISYLLQYGKINKHNVNGEILIDLDELSEYYDSFAGRRERNWKEQLGDDLNWALSFDHLREIDTTKHIHRLHPYKGKFIPQLVEYFLDDKRDDFKKDVFFHPGDIVLDPFSGSGTTLVQATEMKIHAIGLDISEFNCMITDVKLQDVNFEELQREIDIINCKLFENGSRKIAEFEGELAECLTEFNHENFPSPEFKRMINEGVVSEDSYGKDKEQEFLKIYKKLQKKYKVPNHNSNSENFLEKWFCESILQEIKYCHSLIQNINDSKIKKTLTVILSRTMRSCRATSHFDLATLKNPQYATYYCWKHYKICKPLHTIRSWFNRYAKDTISRLREFDLLKKPVHYGVYPADSRKVNIIETVRKHNLELYKILQKKNISGIFTSPPYVGQIDYHEQHAYAYELFGFDRKDDLEIGPLFKGKGKNAQTSYVKGIASVLKNCSKFLKEDYNVFLVANDKHNLYPTIAKESGMKIVNQFKRPVLNRTERDRNPYSEIIFHLKKEIKN